MADITMPKMGFDMTEGTIVKWLKQVGDDVKKGEPIAEIETDKVTIEIEAFESGKLTGIVANEGDVVPVGGKIAELAGPGGDAAQSNGGQQPATTGADATPSAQTEAGDRAPGGSTDADRDVGTSTASDAAAQTEQAAERGGGAQPQPTRGQSAGGEAPSVGYASDETAEEETTGQSQAQASPVPAGEEIERDGPVLASPVAKRLARENNINLAQVQGTGPGGRIVRADVEQALKSGAPAQPAQQAQPAPQPQPQQPVGQQPERAPAPAAAPQQAGTRREPLSRLRQTIARRLVQSKAPVPHFYVTSEIDMGAAGELRGQLNASGDVKITFNDIIVKASAIAMTRFPVLNATFADDALLFHDYINVGIAVATDNGLLAPAVTDVDRKSLGTISREAKELIGRTRDGKATPDELGRGTYSTSNLGMYPVDSFVAIINPPQAVIIAVGAIAPTPVVRNGEIAIGQMMKATISVDHRVADGALAAEYMQELKRLLETPMLILL